jgi:Uma2 family endonuclease
MNLAVPPPSRPMTAEVLMALPEDGVDRELIRGQLRERPMTRRNRAHSFVEARIAQLLSNWLDQQPAPKGLIHSGEAGFRIRREPESFVGIDVAYASAEIVARTDARSPFYEGPPVLAVEILSPSDKHEEIVEKVSEYVAVGTVVWVVDPDFKTVSVHRPGKLPVTLNAEQELCGEPELPGFRVHLGKIFGD